MSAKKRKRNSKDESEDDDDDDDDEEEEEEEEEEDYHDNDDENIRKFYRDAEGHRALTTIKSYSCEQKKFEDFLKNTRKFSEEIDWKIVTKEDIISYVYIRSHWQPGEVCARRRQNADGVRKSKSTIDGVRAALVDIFNEKGLKLPGDRKVKHFITATKKLIQKQIKAGKRDAEGRDYLTVKGYRSTSEWLWEESFDPEHQYFFKLQWNLICRGETSNDTNAKNYSARGDMFGYVSHLTYIFFLYFE